MRKYAHSIQGKEAVSWEELSSHLQDVSTRAASFAAAFGWSEMARIAGLLHDIGKVSNAYQAYIASPAIARLRTVDLLQALPGVGEVRARSIMEGCEISAPRRLKGLGRRQSEALIAYIGR